MNEIKRLSKLMEAFEQGRKVCRNSIGNMTRDAQVIGFILSSVRQHGVKDLDECISTLEELLNERGLAAFTEAEATREANGLLLEGLLAEVDE